MASCARVGWGNWMEQEHVIELNHLMELVYNPQVGKCDGCKNWHLIILVIQKNCPTR